jgi:serine/threonine-protein kinase
VPVLAAQTQKPPYYVVEPRLVGCTVSQLIGGEARPALSVVVWIIRQTAEALDALYRGGWMHADVKPANIFVSPHGHATLLDLGFARRLHDGRLSSGHAFVDRQVCGTPSYIAPELFTSRGTPDIRSDIYSLGVTLYELVTGTRPLEGTSLAELAHEHLTTRPSDLRRIAPQAPDQLSQLVAEMLAKDPLRRPHTPAELIERLVSLEIATFALRGAA